MKITTNTAYTVVLDYKELLAIQTTMGYYLQAQVGIATSSCKQIVKELFDGIETELEKEA